MPSSTMIATAFAVIYCGATPVLVDAEPETWNMDVGKIADTVTEGSSLFCMGNMGTHSAN